MGVCRTYGCPATPNDKQQHRTPSWKDLPWHQLPGKKMEQGGWKLQKRIYQAVKGGARSKAHRLQRLLVRSTRAQYIAVRKVTEQNQGKRTPGIDGVHSLTPKQRQELGHQRHQGTIITRPVRRIWVPKPGKPEKRPLGIPAMADRAHQALILLVLEPVEEAKFEANAYGFRPGRSAWDAIAEIFNTLNKKPNDVWDADIKNCFDAIAHQALSNKLDTIAPIRRRIKAWLQAGVMNHDSFTPSGQGTPQGGVISPLLANIALHGLETAIRTQVKTTRAPIVVR